MKNNIKHWLWLVFNAFCFGAAYVTSQKGIWGLFGIALAMTILINNGYFMDLNNRKMKQYYEQLIQEINKPHCRNDD